MASIEERLQIKREPLDKWSIREQLCLAVARMNDQNLSSVSRALKPFGEPNRPADWFHQKNCAAQYGALLAHVETPKRKKRTSGAEVIVETPAESILRNLLNERKLELKKLLAEEKEEYRKLQADMVLLTSGQYTEEQLDEWCREIDEEERQKEEEAAAHAQWLKERELRKQEIERAWRPLKPGLTVPNMTGMNVITSPTTIKRKQSTILDQSDLNQTPDHSQTIVDSVTASGGAGGGGGKHALSPLLTSLLKSPSQGVAVSSSCSATVASSPTIASLLNSSATITVSPGIQQLVSSAIGYHQAADQSSMMLEAAQAKDAVELLDSKNDLLDAHNIKIDDLANSILEETDEDTPLPDIKSDVDGIISDLIENAAEDIVHDPEQHLQLDGNGDISINLEMDDLDDVDEQEVAALEGFCIAAKEEEIGVLTPPVIPASHSNPPIQHVEEENNHEPSGTLTDDSSSLSMIIPQDIPVHSIPLPVDETAQLPPLASPIPPPQVILQPPPYEEAVCALAPIKPKEEFDELIPKQEVEVIKHENLPDEVTTTATETTTATKIHDPFEFQEDEFDNDERIKEHKSYQAMADNSTRSTIRDLVGTKSESPDEEKHHTSPTILIDVRDDGGVETIESSVDHEVRATDSTTADLPKLEENNDKIVSSEVVTETETRTEEERENDEEESVTSVDEAGSNLDLVVVDESTADPTPSESELHDDDEDNRIMQVKIDKSMRNYSRQKKKNDLDEEFADETVSATDTETTIVEELNNTNSDKPSDEYTSSEDVGIQNSTPDTEIKAASATELLQEVIPSIKVEEPPPPTPASDAQNIADGNALVTADDRSSTPKVEEPPPLPASTVVSSLDQQHLQKPIESESEHESSTVYHLHEDTHPVDKFKLKASSDVDRSNSPWAEADAPDSPASSSFGPGEDSNKDYRSWKKSIMLVYSRLASSKYASVFMKPITEEQAPGYHDVILKPMDLSTIRRSIESGQIRTTLEFQRDVLLMLQNAIMFNRTNGMIYHMARHMQQEFMQQIEMLHVAQMQHDQPSRRETRTSEPHTVSAKRKRSIVMADDLMVRGAKKKKEDVS